MDDGPPAPLTPLPPGFAATVGALHRVAERIVAAARKPDNEIALTVTPGGFGTPVFEDGGTTHQVRVDGSDLVHRVGDDERRAPLTTLGDARRLVAGLVPPAGDEDDAPLGVDPASAATLADWYALAAAVLGDLLAQARPGDDPSAVVLWPEHFDVAADLGDEAAGRRATYGFSPGDDQHPEPYVYVGPWAEVTGDLWRATGFRGAELAYADLLAAPDPRAGALHFLTTRRDSLA
jgi:hypothetical protein